MATEKHSRICAAIRCSNDQYNSNYSFHRFPKDKERSAKWVQNIRRADLLNIDPVILNKNHKVCGAHFEDSQYMNTITQNRLIWNAVPTIFDVPNPPPQIGNKRPGPKLREKNADEPRPRASKEQKTDLDTTTENTLTSTQVSTPNTETTPRKQKLRREIKRLRTQLWRAKKPKQSNSARAKVNACLNQLSQYLPDQTVDFIRTQVRLSERSKQGKRWPIQDKMLALSIFYHSRKAYKVLGKIFSLPSKRTLQRTLQNSNLSPGFNEKIIDGLKTKISAMSETEKNCALVFDEMSLKHGLTYNSNSDSIEGFEDYGDVGKTKFIANHALVFVVRGLQSKWKQPFAYFLTSGTIERNMLDILTKNCIRKLSSIGLSVRVLVCDQGSNNRSFIEKINKVSIESPYFYVDDRKIYVMYDPPHLLKNVRNNFVKHGFLWKGKLIKWEYVIQFYEFDRESSIRMAPKLTDIHINLPPFKAMRVNLAAQILSHSVAAGILALVRAKVMFQEAEETSSFIEKFDQIFNALNSGAIKSSKPIRHAISQNSGHIEFLKESLQFLTNVTLPSGKSVPCLEGWKLSIKSLLGLWNDLSENCGFKYLLTNRLNQDCAENLFSVIRGRGGNRDNPNPKEFRSAFRQVVVEHLLIQSSSANCKDDLDKVLLDLTTISKLNSSRVNVTENDHTAFEIPGLSETINIYSVINNSNVTKDNVAYYMAGYLLRKIKFDCSLCIADFISETVPESDSYTFIKAKMYKEGLLIIPTEKFGNFVRELESVFITVFPMVQHMSKIKSRLVCNTGNLQKALLNCNNSNCSNKIQTAVELYMKTRIYFSLRNANRSVISASNGKRNRKVLKIMHV